jgi:hypothetical protein
MYACLMGEAFPVLDWSLLTRQHIWVLRVMLKTALKRIIMDRMAYTRVPRIHILSHRQNLG